MRYIMNKNEILKKVQKYIDYLALFFLLVEVILTIVV